MNDGREIVIRNCMREANGNPELALELCADEVVRLFDASSLGYLRGEQPAYAPVRVKKDRAPPVLIDGEA